MTGLESNSEATRRASSAIVYAAALCSGAATLIYELAWIRGFTLVVGATYPSITVVLAGFMLGLGLGALLGGRWADRSRRPLRAYALVELAVLAGAALVPLATPLLSGVPVPGFELLEGRALLAGLLMLPATTLMGMTLPLLSVALHPGDAHASHVPALYGVNTLGAMLGCVLGGLILPYAIGVSGTLAVGAALNLCAAGVAWLGSARAERAPLQVGVRGSPVPEVPVEVRGPRVLAGLLALAFGSGVLVMGAELFWARAMMQVERRALAAFAVESTDVVALVLGLVLLGNAVGALWSARFGASPLRRVAELLAATWVAGGLLSLLSLEWFAVWAAGASPSVLGSAPELLVGLRLLLLLPPSVLLGFGFPLLARLVSGAVVGHGQRLSWAWAMNTAGAVLGSVVCGWWLMPTVGTGRGVVLCAALAVALAGLSLVIARSGWPIRAMWGAAVIGVAATAGLVPLAPGQVYAARPDQRVVASWEGWEATTLVVREPSGLRLVSNGRSIGAKSSYVTGGRVMTSRVQSPRRVLLVGFGTGLFAAGVLQDERVERLVIVEIDGAQFQAAPWFETTEVLKDERVELVVDDALHFLAATEVTFDLIIVDAWGPEASPAIYGQEFQERALARLSPTGVTWAKMIPLDQPGRDAVYDAFRCTYASAAVGEGFIVGGRRLPRFAAERLRPADEDCAPMRVLWPVRLVAL